jgi:hypothetical protein
VCENSSEQGSSRATDQGVPHISLVLREMWETAAADLQFPARKGLPVEVRVSHISQKTSEIWGTP